MQKKIIGLVGGMGPYAGLDIHRKIYANTAVQSEQEHLDVIHFALGQGIPDRTAYLLGKTTINPAEALAQKIHTFPLDIVGVACNTFHAPSIFNVFQAILSKKATQVLHLPNEIARAVEQQFAKATIGVFCTEGTRKAKIYQDAFRHTTIQLKFPSLSDNRKIQQAIYHPDWGIKKDGQPSATTTSILEKAIQTLLPVDAILLACTELPLVAQQIACPVPIIDCNQILAKAFVCAALPKHVF